jgi:hypothetical protein
MHGATMEKRKSLINFIASKSQSGKYYIMGGNKRQRATILAHIFGLIISKFIRNLDLTYSTYKPTVFFDI